MLTIGKRLQAIRLKKGLSQYQLATMSKVPRGTLIRIEQDKVEPRISTLEKIAKGLGVNVFDFLSK
jgi:transcriptional regulator with XRE-family HTH domain